MTDLEAKAREIATQFGMWPDGSFAEIIATALREARTQALEEAISVANKIGSDLGESALGHVIATGIRALKDTTPSD
jgi:hypothetical protein